MRKMQTCCHCCREISLSAWICPHCGSWVGDVNRGGVTHPAAERAAA